MFCRQDIKVKDVYTIILQVRAIFFNHDASEYQRYLTGS